MLSGFKGVKYGLQPGAKARQKGLVGKPLAVFADDDGDGGAPSVGKDIARQAATKRADAKVAQQHAAALAEDASVFDYDGVYDELQAQRAAPKQAEKLARKSRYIEGLLDKAKEREREQDIVYERKLAKEREAEDHLFGDKDKFVTAAYKKKLQEDQKWLAEERVREAAEKRDSVVSRGHMGDFYRNVLTNNAAFGTSQAKQPAPAADAAEAAAAPQDSAWEAARRARAAYEAQAAARQGGPDPAGAAGAAGDPAAAPAEQRGSAAPVAAAADEREGQAGGAAGEDKRAGRASGAAEAGSRTEAAAGAEAGEQDEGAAAALPAEAPVDKAAKAASARERYLARKRKVPG